MPEEIPPRNDGGSQDLETVPERPDFTPSKPTEPTGLGVYPARPIEISPGPVVAPPVAAAASSKPVIAGLSVVVAGLAAFSGYEFLQNRDLQEQLAEAPTQPTTVIQTNQGLESDLNKMREELDSATKAHTSAISEKDQALSAVEEETRQIRKKLEAEEGKIKGLVGKVEATDAAIQEQARLEAALADLKNTNQELQEELRLSIAEVGRLNAKLTSRVDRSSTAPASKIAPAPVLSAKRATFDLYTVPMGENRINFYFIAPDGFKSGLYPSSEAAIQAANARGFKP